MLCGAKHQKESDREHVGFEQGQLLALAGHSRGTLSFGKSHIQLKQHGANSLTRMSQQDITLLQKCNIKLLMLMMLNVHSTSSNMNT